MYKLDPNSIKTVEGLKGIQKILKSSLRLSLYEVGDDIKKEARRLILEPPKTGRIYNLELKGVPVKHQASAPGEAPANFTGDLRNTVNYKVKGSNELRIVAGSEKVDYAGKLEFGSNELDGVVVLPRPYLEPAINRSDRNFTSRVVAYIVKRTKLAT